MSVINNALVFHFGRSLQGFGGLLDNLPAAATGAPLKSGATQVTSTAGGSTLLKSISRGEANAVVFVVNNGGAAWTVGPQSGDTLNGGSTPLSIPAGQSAICVPDLNNSGVSSNDWRCAVLS
jgi:hypothetical protein